MGFSSNLFPGPPQINHPPSTPVDSNAAANTVAEGAAVNTLVGVTASSTDDEGDPLTYSLSGDSSGGGFKINPTTGVVSVADPSKIDFETAAGHVYTVTAQASDGFSTSPQTFTIAVTDIVPSTPVDSDAAANRIVEGAASGTTVGLTASSTDINGPAVTYSLTGDTSGGGFTINSTTGVITVADATKIDYETAAGHAYAVTARASDGTLSSSQSFNIDVVDVDLSVPVDSNAAANTVAEGAAAGSTVGVTVSAVDPNGPAPTYSLLGDSSGGGFAVNSSTGVVTVADPSKIDFESSSGHVYKIVVLADSGTNRTTQQFTIGVTDVAPSTPTDSNATPNNVNEGAVTGSPVGITASSTDVNGPGVTWSLIGDSSHGGFDINPFTGEVVVVDGTKIDYETSPGHAYTVTAQASDGTLSSSRTFTINVNDIDMTVPADVNAAANTVAEGAAAGSTVGVTVSAFDRNGPTATYSLLGDSSGGGFAINASTGVVTVADPSKIDFESSPGHVYKIVVLADNGTRTTQQFTIGVTDVDLSVPVDSNAAANTVAEGAAAGSTVGVTVSAFDPNGPAVTYSLLGDSTGGGAFAINSTTGVVTVADPSKIDFESSPGHTIKFVVLADSGTNKTTQQFTIGVTDVAPSAPIDTNGAANTVFEGAANGTAVGITAFSADPGGGPAPIFSLTNNAGGRFAIDANTGVVTVANGAAIDFETAPSHAYGITVQATSGALSSTQNFSIGVANINEAPAGTDKAVLIAEDTPYVFSVADFGFTDPNDNSAPNSLLAVKMTTVPGAGAGTLTNNGVAVNAGDFVLATDIAAGHLVFTPALNANGSPEASFTFQVQDNGGTANGGVDLDQSPNTFTINVNAVNDAPVNSVPGTQSVNEDATLTFSAGNGNAITISDVDVGSGNETVTLTVASGILALGSTANLTSFTNNAASITLTGTVANVNAALNGLTYHGNLNFNGADSLVVSTSDNGNTGSGGPRTDTDSVTINVTSVNDAPAGTDKAVLTAEDTPYVFGVADFGFTDPNDSSAPNSLLAVKMTTVPGAGAGTLTNNGIQVNAGDFVLASDIAAGHLVFTPVLNANGSPLASFTFQVQDDGGTANGGVDLDQSPNTLTINVSAVNDAPVVTAGHTLNYTENQAATAIDTLLTVSDVDSANLASATVQITGNYVNGEDLLAFATIGAISGTFDALTGTLTLTGSDTVANYQAALRTVTYVNTSDNPSGAARTVTIIANDGAASSVAATDTINVTPVNDAPVVTAGHTLNYTENQAATAIDTALTVSDVDSPNLASATVQITGNYVNGEDLLAFATIGAISGTFDALTGTLTLTGSDTVANYQAALRTVTYVNTSDNPSGAARTVTIVTNDGFLSSTPATDTINVTPVNDAPVVTAGHTLNYTENQAATAIDTLLTVSDVDSANLASATVQITGNYVNGEDLLAFATIGAISGTFDALTGTLTLIGSDTVANYEAALRTVTYVNTSDNPSGAARTVTIIANDGAASSVAATDTINVTPVNDAPVVTAGHTLNYTENQAATAIDPALIVADVDSPNLASATVQITGNYVNGEDLLAFATIGAISGTFDALTGTLTLTGSDTVANYQAALRTVTYVNTSENPSGAARTVTIIANDGAASSVAATDTINVTPVNDAPVVTAGHTLNYTENQAATAIDTALTVSDVDSANLASATVQITGNYVNGEDLLAFATIGAISGTFDALTGTLTLTGSDTVANYEAALRTVTYVNTSENPSGAARTVTIIANDGAANSVAVTDTITVTPVNDAPVVVAGHTLNYAANQPATAIDPAITASDVDSPNLASATVQITGGYVNGEDVLGFSNTASITGTFDALSGTMTLTGSDTVANYQAALASVTYFNTSPTPSGASRTVTIIANDGAANSVAATDTISFDVAPTVTAGHTLNYTENQAATAFDPALTVTDPDSANLTGATVQITGAYVNGEDVLAFATIGAISGTFDALTGTMTLTGSDTVANYQAALRTVTYVNTSENPSGAARTVTIVTNDGILNSTPATDTINVTPVNDVPVVTAGHTLNYTENQVATAIDTALTVSDVDNTNLASATVQITANYVNGEDVLAFANTATITGTFDALNGKLTLTGSDTVANYEAALRAVTYVNTSANPSGAARTVTIIANDGAANSVAATDTITVTPVNNAPVVTAGHTLNYTENQVATAIDPALGVSDVDSANLNSATVQITGNYVTGEDVLAFATIGGISGTFDAPSGKLTLSGSDSVAHYQAALRTVTYHNTSDNPSGAARIVTIIANDGALNSVATTDTINVTPVNDAPTVAFGVVNGFTENGTPTSATSVPVTIAPNLTVSDVDSANLTQATFVLNNLKPSDALSVSGHAGASGDIGNIHFAITSTATTETVTLTGTDTIAHYNAVLDLVQFNNTSDNPDTTLRSYTVTAVDDGTGTNTGSASTNETVTSVDDAPVNNGVPGSFTVMSGFTHAITGLSISDLDAGSGNDITTTLTSADGGFVTVGAVGGGAAITGNGGGAVTLTGTVGQINASLGGSVVYTAADNVTASTTTTLTIATNDHGHTGTGGPITDTDVVTVGVTPQVWFINADQSTLDASASRGSQTNPFTDVTEFNAASLTATGPGNNDTIYVKAGTYSGPGINLKDGQTLLGDDQALSLADPFGGPAIVIETSSGARPTINVTTAGDQGIDLGVGNTIHGINITTAAGTTGLDDGQGAGGNAVGALTVDQMQISGAGQAVDIDQGGALTVSLESLSSSGGAEGIQLAGTASSGAGLLSGTFSVGGTGAISGSTTAGIMVGNGGATASAGGTVAVTYNGTVTTTGTAHAVDIQDRAASAGNIGLSGTISHASGNGSSIFLDQNAAGTIAFSGANSVLNSGTTDAVHITNNGATVNFTGDGLNIDATSGAGFLASGGGTVNVTGSSNSIATGTGTALNINGTTIGASGLTFHDISSNGAPSGIILNTTGSSGGLTVTGNAGGTINATGGTITGSTASGISLTSTSNVSLDHMTVSNSGDDGITGSSVTGFTLADSTISGNGNAANTDHGLDFTNLFGTSSITNTTLSNNQVDQARIQNSSGSATVTFDGVTFQSTGLASAPNGEHGLVFDTHSTGSADLNVKNSTFNNLFSNSIDILNDGTGVLETTINNNTFTNVGASGITIAQQNPDSGGAGIVRFYIHDNGTAGSPTFLRGTNNGTSSSININQADNNTHSTGGVLEGQISNNFIGNNSSTTSASTGGSGIAVSSVAPGTTTVQIDHNTIQGEGADGIFATMGEDANPAHTMNLRIFNNSATVSDVNSFDGIFIEGGVLTGDQGTLRLDMHDNTASSVSGNDFTLRQRFLTTDQLLNYGGANNDNAAVQTYLDVTKNNTAVNNTWFITNNVAGGGGGFVNTASVPGPTLPSPLLAAPGGVQASSPTPGETHLTQAELDSVVAAAIGQWALAGASASQLAALHATVFSVADLSGNIVAQEASGHIQVDTDAAGHGWFIDPTPNDNSEFTHAANAAGTDLYTDPTNAAAGHMDLLTSVTHELGHVLGLDDSTAASDANDLMYINLVDGERRLPDATDVAQANGTGAMQAEAALPVSAQAAAGTPVVVGTSGNDTIDAGHGGNILFGGAGADHFVFGPGIQLNAPTPAQITHVADYSAAQGDTFDFSAITSAFHNSSVNDSLVVRAVEDASGKFATLQVDHIDPMGLLSAPNWINVAQLDGAHAGDAVNILIDNHSVHLAQIHVDLLV
jgi:hypothetical protein